MGYASESISRGSDHRAGLRAVLAHSLGVSTAPDEEFTPSLVKAAATMSSDLGDCSLPRNVVASSHRSLHYAAVFKGVSFKDLPPPPPLVKTQSLDSVSSASSAGSVAKGTSSSPSRTIFKRYWEVSKAPKVSFVPARSEPSSSFPSSVREMDEAAEEGTPAAEEATNDNSGAHSRTADLFALNQPRRRLSATRRSIIGSATGLEALQSAPSLHSGFHPAMRRPLSKASSTSVLLKSRRSCLHKVQTYSVGADAVRTLRRSSSSSVSFRPEVDVYEFQKPGEIHAQEGWTDWFH